MAEYWKSTPKYWCKHCKTFVVDTKLGRTQHESTARHQGNLKRFLNDLHKNKQIETNQAEAAKREVARLNALVDGKPQRSGAIVVSNAGSGTTSPYATGGPALDTERKRQLRELESLGVALPEEFRRDVALPGEWQMIEPVDEPPEKSRHLVGSKAKQEEEESKEKTNQELIRKRRLEEEERKWNELDDDEKALQGFKIQEKTFPVDADGEYEGLNASPFFEKGKKKLHSETKQDVQVQENIVVVGDGISIKKEEVEISDLARNQGSEGNSGDGIMFKKRKIRNIRKK